VALAPEGGFRVVGGHDAEQVADYT
jgi:hypothetical protein